MCEVLMEKRNQGKKQQKVFKEMLLDKYGNYIAPKVIEKAKRFNLQKQYNYFINVSTNTSSAIAFE